MCRQTDGAGGRVTTNAVGVCQGLDVGVDHIGGVAGDGRALLAVVGTDLHTLDFLAGRLRLDSRHIPARPAVVLGAGEVEFTPCAAPASKLISGQVLTLGSTPGTLGVVIDGNVASLTGLEGELESGVAVPSSKLAIGAHLVPEDDSPRVSVATLEFHHMLVLRGLVGGDLDDVATPGVTGVTLVVDVFGTVGVGLLAETFASILAIGRGGPPVDIGRAAGFGGGFSGGGSRSRSLGRGFGGFSIGSIGSGGGSVAASGKVVNPRLDDAVDGGIDHITTTFAVVSMTALMAVETGNRGPSGQRCEPKEGVLELHLNKPTGLIVVKDRTTGYGKSSGYAEVSKKVRVGRYIRE